MHLEVSEKKAKIKITANAKKKKLKRASFPLGGATWENRKGRTKFDAHR